MKQRREVNAVAIACLALAAVLLVVYVSGYFFLSEGVVVYNAGMDACRSYPTQWLAVIYRPATAIEGMIRGREIESLSRESWEWGTES